MLLYLADGMVRRAEMIPMVDLDNAPSRILLQEVSSVGLFFCWSGWVLIINFHND